VEQGEATHALAWCCLRSPLYLQVILAAWMFFCGKYTSVGAFIQTWLGTAVLVCVVLLIHYT
jgi:hypothetical protein